MLKVEHLTGGYGNEAILKHISFCVKRGEMFGILGPNGSGKTTLLKMISGIQPFMEGEILLNERTISSYTQKQLANIIAVLPQHSAQAFSYSVKETVSLGRYSHHSGWFKSWSEKDERVVQQVMEQTGILDFQDKNIQELSGGERQRVFLAQALAQEPQLLLLDEPTNHLDLSFQKELLDLLKRWTGDRGLTVVSIFHDLNLAGLYCDRLLLLEEGMINIHNTPVEVLKEERIEAVYQTKIEKQPHPKVPAPQMVLLPDSINDVRSHVMIDQSMLSVTDERILLKSAHPLRTMSSGVTGAGTGWNDTFVNRRVGHDYTCDDPRQEMSDYLIEHGFESVNTVGMMTAVSLRDLAYRFLDGDGFSVFIVVTAGVGNAIDASKSDLHEYTVQPGTINTWVFVNGEMTEEAFIQATMSATEAKVKALHDERIIDRVTGTFATGTATDSILIASTQSGKKLEFAGTITPLGKKISKGVYDCTTEAIQTYKNRK